MKHGFDVPGNGFMLLMAIVVVLSLSFGCFLLLTMASLVENDKFASSTPEQSCPGVPRLTWLNDTTFHDSIVYECSFLGYCNERIDWHATRENYMKRCHELQQQEKNVVLQNEGF